MTLKVKMEQWTLTISDVIDQRTLISFTRFLLEPRDCIILKQEHYLEIYNNNHM